MSIGTTAPTALMTVPEAAEMLAVGKRTLTRWSAMGRAPKPIKITPGRRGCVRYRRAELLAWIEAGCPDLRAETPSK